MQTFSCNQSDELAFRRSVYFHLVGLQQILRSLAEIPGIDRTHARRVAGILRNSKILSDYVFDTSTPAIAYTVDVIYELIQQLGVAVYPGDWILLRAQIITSCSGYVAASVNAKAEQLEAATKVEPGVKSEVKSEDSEAPAAVGGDLCDDMTAAEFYNRMSLPQLVQLMLGKDRCVRDVQAKLETCQILAAKWRKLAWKVQKKWKGVRQVHRRGKKVSNKDKYHTGEGTMRGRLSQWGGIMASVMRSVASCSAWRCGASLQTDISRHTVVRWERVTDACDSMATRTFYNEKESVLRLPTTKDFQYSVHAIRADATNTKVLHKQSVQVTVPKLKSSFC